MNTLAIFIPTYHRPHSMERAATNAHENTTTPHTLYFVSEPDDQATIDKSHELKENLIISKYPGSHTGAANTAYWETKEPFFIMANDDFNFHKDWDTLALAKMAEGVGVVGLNDGFSGNMTAITLVRRAYIKEHSGVMDADNTLYHPGYNHNFVDTELSTVCKKRGMWAECPESVVEHMHWAFNKSVKDATYEKSNATEYKDRELFGYRSHLWL